MSGEVSTIVVLHGHDSSAKMADELARELDPELRWHHVAPDGPLGLPTGGRAWFDVDVPGSLATAAECVTAVVTAAAAEVATDPSGVAVIGYSQGAAAALAALTSPGAPHVGRLVCLNGFVVDDGGAEFDWSALGETRVLLQHGELDDVVPPFFSADLASLLADAGVDVTYQVFAMGHERTEESIGAARAWLCAAR